MSRLWQFSGDLAHEMRTPLSTLLGRTQVALSRERSAEQLANVLEKNMGELERLTRLVNDMLFLAQAENARSAVHLQTVHLHEVARQIAEYLQLRAGDRCVSIAVEGEASVRADAGLVQRALMNLLSNAIRHASTGSAVQVRVRGEAAAARVEVINRGHPIAAEHLEHLYDRFYRIAHSSADHDGGTGLGLAIVKAIMDLHSGRVGVVNDPGNQVRFWLEFPGQPSPP